MKLILAFIFPTLMFLLIGRPFSALICLLLHFTLIGWIPATIWALFALSEHNDERRYRQAYRHYA